MALPHKKALNPAGRAVAALISHYLPLLPDYAKHKFSRVCGQQEAVQHQPYKIDSTLNTLSTGKLAQVSIFTTGLLWANQQAYSPKLIEHLTSSSLVIVEEAQQAADIKTAFATSLLPAESLLVYQGDDKREKLPLTSRPGSSCCAHVLKHRMFFFPHPSGDGQPASMCCSIGCAVHFVFCRWGGVTGVSRDVLLAVGQFDWKRRTHRGETLA